MKRVLVIDDDRDNQDVLNQHLASEGYSVQVAADADLALRRVKAWKPHLLLLDLNMPGISGLELIPRIRAVSVDDYVSIVIVTASSGNEDVVAGFDAGADDYITKPFRAQELISRVRVMFRFKELQDSLRRATRRIEDLSSTDDLTGLLNMRAFYRKGEEELLRAKRFRKPVSVLLVNLDGFSAVNRNYGFGFGSFVLQEAGSRIKQCLRSVDFVARIGADEFFALLTETDLAGAEFMAERIRDGIQADVYKNDRQSTRVTASIGVAAAAHGQPEQSLSDLLHTATEALRSAKSNGPNKIEIHSFS